MSYYRELNDLYNNDIVAFEMLMSNTAPDEASSDDEEFRDIPYETKEIIWNGYTIVFGERAVRALYKNGGGATRVESSFYYMIDNSGTFVKDDEVFNQGIIEMQNSIDEKYS